MKATIQNLVEHARKWYIQTKNTCEDHVVIDENTINAKFSHSELEEAHRQGYLHRPAGSDRYYIRLA